MGASPGSCTILSDSSRWSAARRGGRLRRPARGLPAPDPAIASPPPPSSAKRLRMVPLPIAARQGGDGVAHPPFVIPGVAERRPGTGRRRSEAQAMGPRSVCVTGSRSRAPLGPPVCAAKARLAGGRRKQGIPLPVGGGRIACDPTTGLSVQERSDWKRERVRVRRLP